MTEGEDSLNVYTRNPNNGRECPYGSKKKKYGCPIEDFRMTGEGVKVRFPQVRHPGDFQAGVHGI